MLRTNLEITTNHILALGALVAVGLVYYRVKSAASGVVGGVADALNPVNPDNVINSINSKAAGVVDGVLGDGFNSKFDDHFFGLIDLINPLNESDDYARKVWGLGDE